MLRFAGFPLSAWAFALRTWAAMMLALYVAFWLQLENGYIAAFTVGSLPADAGAGLPEGTVPAPNDRCWRCRLDRNCGVARPSARPLCDSLRDLAWALRGVLFSSNPRGHNEEGWNGGRYVVYYDLNAWRRYVSAAGFVELSHYYRPAGLPRERQPWLASVWRR